MSTLFAVNENNDIFATETGRLALVTGLTATLQHAKHAVEARRGEMIYATDRGIEYLDNVFSGAVNLLQFEAHAREAIARVPDVVFVANFEADIVNNTLVYTAEIQTNFGAGVISGNV